MTTSYVNLFLFRMSKPVDHRKNDQCENGGEQDAADYDSSQRSLHLCSGAGRQGHRYETQRGDKRRHQDRPKAGDGPFPYRFVQPQTLRSQIVDEADDDETIQYGYAGKSNKADNRRNRSRESPSCQCCKPAGKRQRHA